MDLGFSIEVVVASVAVKVVETVLVMCFGMYGPLPHLLWLKVSAFAHRASAFSPLVRCFGLPLGASTFFCVCV